MARLRPCGPGRACRMRSGPCMRRGSGTARRCGRCARMSGGTMRLTSWRGRWRGRGSMRRRGALVLTSRLSVDLVQKAAMIGARVLIAPSAPTALAVAEAQAAGLALIARGPDGPTLYTETEAE
ncbi:formate dehydrogenase accessory sulfurtransferase FdhD [Rhodobacter capsulatus]